MGILNGILYLFWAAVKLQMHGLCLVSSTCIRDCQQLPASSCKASYVQVMRCRPAYICMALAEVCSASLSFSDSLPSPSPCHSSLENSVYYIYAPNTWKWTYLKLFCSPQIVRVASLATSPLTLQTAGCPAAFCTQRCFKRIITSATEVMFSSAFVGQLICQQDYAKTTKRIFTKFGGKVAHGPRKKPVIRW